jgi:hypothetical protein
MQEAGQTLPGGRCSDLFGRTLLSRQYALDCSAPRFLGSKAISIDSLARDSANI